MFKPLEIFVGLRYLRAKRRNHFVSFISLISLLGVALGVMALVVVLSVMNGFEGELRKRILGMTSHAAVISESGSLKGWQKLRQDVLQESHVLGAAPYVEGQALLANGTILTGSVVRGVDPRFESEVSDVDARMIVGRLSDLSPESDGMALGRVLALILNVDIGDPVSLMTVQGDPDGGGVVPRIHKFTVTGIFDAGQPEYDTSLSIIHRDPAAQIFGIQGGVTGVRMKLDDMFRAPEVAANLEKTLASPLTTSDWTREHTTYFRAVKTEKIVIAVVLFLIVAVAAFNIVATLVMVVTDKQSDIAVLRTLGLKPKSVMGVFLVQGLVIGVVGTGIGLILGVLLALNTETVFPFLE
ncbi:MAG: lipoprotein-releasing ABC transporter permease subunit, partial [Pseudomonadota bacterium]